jgi:aspartyl-tRNA(Asn)/glutamyl-tRNA(Gln) amidotransferase subunit C
MARHLSLEEVGRIAALARLRLAGEELERFRGQLSAVLDHVAQLQELDVTGVEPMYHPTDFVNRLDDDAVEPSLPADAVLALAPESEAGYLAVPKVLPGEEP